MGKPRHARRLATRLAACAVIGAVITVGVALGCLLLSHPKEENFVKSGPYSWPIPMPAGAPASASMMQEEKADGVDVHIYIYSDRSGSVGWTVTLVEAGLPFRAGSLKSYRSFPHPPIIFSLAGGDRKLLLPNRPILSGFALDTAFYAIIALTLWPAPGFVRRRLCRARGQCPACGYDLKGAPTATCPECGR